MFTRDHPPPHVHVECQGREASLDVVRLEFLRDDDATFAQVFVDGSGIA